VKYYDFNYSRALLIQTLVIRITIYPNGLSGKFGENSTELTCLEITDYWINYSTVLWLIELQIRRGRRVYTKVHTVNSNSQTSNCHFKKKNPLAGFSAYPDNSPYQLMRLSGVLL
jgi:hypothetical protein